MAQGLQVGTGQAPVKRYNRYLRDLIIARRAKPSFVVSHELPLDQAPMAYDKFDRRVDGFTKMILHPASDWQTIATNAGATANQPKTDTAQQTLANQSRENTFQQA
jgi:hypothetical protein